MENVSNLRFVFKTKAKRNIVELFNHICPKNNQISEKDLIESNDSTYLLVDLDKWKDIDTGSILEPVCKVMMKLTDPKSGRPGYSLNTAVTGYDNEAALNFILIGEYVKGHHSIIGYREDGNEIIYCDSFIVSDNKDLDRYHSLNEKYN